MSAPATTRAVWTAAGVVVAAAATFAAHPTTSQTPRNLGDTTLVAYLPPGQGQALVSKQCTGCHDLKGVLRLRAPAEKWEALVLDMGARGAPIELDDVDPMVKYLSEVFGPKAPPFVDVNEATKAELTQLPGVSAEAADRLITARGQGALTSSDQVRTALGIDQPAFDKIKYYVYVKSSPPRNR